MTPESQRIAIAEACGWKPTTSAFRTIHDEDGNLVTAFQDIRCYKGNEFRFVPDYLDDLNAMHEAEKVLTGDQAWEYVQLLAPNGGWCATAAQRAEALLRTLNLWVEEPVSEATVEGLR